MTVLLREAGLATATGSKVEQATDVTLFFNPSFIEVLDKS
jgi:hypothetical protein